MDSRGGQNTDSLLLNDLKTKYFQNDIYSYISEVLVAINPNKANDSLYSYEMIKKYRTVSLGVLPPHIFSVANEIVQNLRVFENDQSVIISGQTGSGKTETTKYLIKFLCGSISTQFAEQIINTNVLLEAFGNSCTKENANSSRFVKVVKVNYDADNKVCGIKLDAHLLENNRVCSEASAKFHVFFYLLNGTPKQLRSELSLEPKLFSCLLDQLKHRNDKDDVLGFKQVDQTFDFLGFTETKKKTIYQRLAAILHLGQIEYKDAPDMQAQIVESSVQHIIIAARLLNLSSDELKEALIYKVLSVGGTKITQSLTSFAACKIRDTMAKSVYQHLFRLILSSINEVSSRQSNLNIKILDIAGFECFDVNNQYEQFCINYANEKLQQFCTQRLIVDEQEYYESEGIALPKIPFPGNEIILNLLDHKTTGIFLQLDNECKMPNPNLKRFMVNVNSTHANSPAFLSNHRQNSFTIEHFSGKVTYQTGNFLTNNTEIYPASVCNLVGKTILPLYSKELSLTSGKTTKKTSGENFRMELNSLLSQLKQTRTRFIRCIKPNFLQIPGQFDENFVCNQLQSYGIFAYFELMQFGYPSKVEILDLYSQLEPNLKTHHISIGKIKCCQIFLLANGFQSKDFKLGKLEIHIRPGKSQLLDQMYHKIKEFNGELALQFDKYVKAYKIRIFYVRFKFLGALFLRVKQRQIKEGSVSEADLKNVPEESKHGIEAQYESNELSQAHASTNPLSSIVNQEKKHEEKQQPKLYKKTQTQREKKPKCSERFDGLNHWPEYDDPNESRKGYRCKFCGAQSDVYCFKCNVHLCFVKEKAKKGQEQRRVRNCFKAFHNLEES